MAKKKTAGEGTQDGDEAASRPYVVLARKYRPQTFDDLIGQEAMVRTLVATHSPRGGSRRATC